MEIREDLTPYWHTNISAKVSRLTNQNRWSNFKIGITNDPERRASDPEYASFYDEMVIIAATNSYDEVCEIERELIEYHWEVCDNRIGGGGGPGRRSQPPYYVYIVRRENLGFVQRMIRDALKHT